MKKDDGDDDGSDGYNTIVLLVLSSSIGKVAAAIAIQQKWRKIVVAAV